MDLTIMDNYDLLVMKIIHYFIVKENYSPIIIKGIVDEIWLEYKNNEFSIVRIVTRNIINNASLYPSCDGSTKEKVEPTLIRIPRAWNHPFS